MFCHWTIYPNEVEVNDTTKTQKYVPYLDLHLEIYKRGRLKIETLRQNDDFTLLSQLWIFRNGQPVHDDDCRS
jgi:hypothetical protein